MTPCTEPNGRMWTIYSGEWFPMTSGQYERWYLRPENPSLAAPKHERIKTKIVLLQLKKLHIDRKDKSPPSVELGKHHFQLPSPKNRGTSFTWAAQSVTRCFQGPNNSSLRLGIVHTSWCRGGGNRQNLSGGFFSKWGACWSQECYIGIV